MYFSQKGIAQIPVMILLLVGIIFGVFLVGQTQIFIPKAAEIKKSISLPGSNAVSNQRSISKNDTMGVIPSPSQEIYASTIVDLGYQLIDAYIKAYVLPPGGGFPNGQFEFRSAGGVNPEGGVSVEFTPADIENNLWRVIVFRYPDHRASTTILDGPISGSPGTPNPESLRGAKETLSSILNSSQMTVFIDNKDNPDQTETFNFNDPGQFKLFLQRMIEAIVISPTPTPAPGTSKSCSTDADCGVNICKCEAFNNAYISGNDRICTRYCPGQPRCINNQCELIQ